MFNGLDYALLIIILISTLVSVWRGFTREVLSLVALGVSVWVMLMFSPAMAVFLEPYIESEQIRLVVAFISLFLMTLLVAALINRLVVRLVDMSGLTTYDRMLGMVFGATRAGLLIVFFVLLANLTSLPQMPLWDSSLLMPYFETIADWLHQFLPDQMRSLFNFE